MEVLHGNQAGSKYSRRRSDRNSLAQNRLLDWALHDSDIALLPYSPLALADVLTQSGGYLDLIARQENDSKTANEPMLHSTQIKPEDPEAGLKSEDAVKQRFNLLTNHSESELLRQCKKILVENALIKNKGDRQLYLAAGFISWASTKNPDVRQRAPLLLYPALLVRIPDEQKYEIRLAGDTPEFNVALLHHLEQRHACTLPTLDEDTPLADFFSAIAASVRHQSTIELHMDIALGSATLVATSCGKRRVNLPKIPVHFDTALAMSITGNKNLEQLNALLHLIPDFSPADDASETVKNSSESIELDGASSLRRYAAKLAAEGLEHIEFRQLPSLPSQISRFTEQMSLALMTPTLYKVLKIDELSARQLIRLAGIIELIDKAPNGIEKFGHGDLCYANSTLLMRRAQHQARLIEDELKALSEHFHLDKVPAKPRLLSLMSELGGNNDHGPDLVDAEYFHARRQFMEFSINKPAKLTTEHRRLLSQLAKVLRFRELFVNNVEYREALGRGYKGLRTDWAQLLIVSDYSRELADVIDSETIAAAIITNWEEFRASFVQDLGVLQNAAEATRQLLSILDNRWQKQTVVAFAAHALTISTQIEQWQEQYGPMMAHADKTAAVVLSSFSGSSMDHVLIETQADETQARLRKQLDDGEIRIEQVSDTLSWLTLAGATASQGNLDIDSILEYLQSA